MDVWLYRETLTAASLDAGLYSCLGYFPMTRYHQNHAVAGIPVNPCNHGTTPGSPEPVKSWISEDEDVTNGYHKTAIFAERANRDDKRKNQDGTKKPESLSGSYQSGFVSYV